jgi:sugar lactone lactonase YvrE
VAVDGAGDVFVTDSGTSQVYEIVAVGGVVSSSSTMINIASAYTNFGIPVGIAVDAAGDVFVSDQLSAALLEVVAVGGVVSSNSTANVVASNFHGPNGVAVDPAGDVFIAAQFDRSVYEVEAVGGVVSSNSTVVTVGSGFGSPSGLAVDAAGDVYVADGGGALYEIVAAGGAVSSNSTVITLPTASIDPSGIAIDGAGNIFVADLNTPGVFELPMATPPSLNFPNTLVGNTSGPLTAQLENIGNANLSFTSLTETSSSFSTTNTTCSTGTAIAASGFCTLSATFTPPQTGPLSGTYTVTDNSLYNGSRMQTFALTGNGNTTQTITFPQPASGTVGGSGTLTATASSGLPVTFSIPDPNVMSTLSGPYNSTITYKGAETILIAADQAGNATYAPAPTAYAAITIYRDLIYVVDNNGTSVLINENSSQYLSLNNNPNSTNATLGAEAFDGNGDAWSVTATSNSLGYIPAAFSGSTSYTGGGLSGPSSLAVDGQGYVWIANSTGNSVSAFDNSGNALETTAYSATASHAPAAVQGSPSGVAIDTSGGVWVTNKTGNSVTHIIGAAIPVVTPMSTAVSNGTVATKP